ncbi:YrhK family protein [Tateyamaria sp.]|uniref:YrhK family protein n=1 Tax=Tateyamaria sp. TaxID=1929288 RepID=UPI00329AFBF5
MMIFEPPHSNRSEAWKRRFAAFEIVHTLIDFGAALCFIIGSIMFFSEEWLTPGTWLFLVGSILFACKPTVRLIRELQLAAHGDVDALAKGEGGT